MIGLERLNLTLKRMNFIKIYIDYPRKDLIERIEKRTEQMIKMGAINEVKRFIKLKIKKDNSVNKAIGLMRSKNFLIMKRN